MRELFEPLNLAIGLGCDDIKSSTTMPWEFTRFRKKQPWFICVCFAFFAVAVGCGIHRDIDALILPASLSLAIAVLLFILIYKCVSCGNLDIRFGAGTPVCRKCEQPYEKLAETILNLFQDRQRLMLEIPLLLPLLFYV
jgi:hypothetical protein